MMMPTSYPPGLAEALDAFEATLIPVTRLNATHDDETATRVAEATHRDFGRARDVALALMRTWRLRSVSYRGTWYYDVRTSFAMDDQDDKPDILTAIRPHQRARVKATAATVSGGE
jgi:hypothetical protein